LRIKGLLVARSAELRADEADDGLGTMIVRFSPFDTWYEINSYWEGRFLERTAPGAFKKTAREAKRADGRYSTKVLYNHGMDLYIGDKVLGVPTRFEEVDTAEYRGPELEVPLLDTTYNRDLLPGLRQGAYGSSFMFDVIREEWDQEPGIADHNPEGLPERTINEVRTFEAGPVTWPASPTATAGMRSLTDMYVEQLSTRDGRRHEDLVRSLQAFRAARRTPDQVQLTPTPDPERSRRQVDDERTLRQRRLRDMQLRLMKASR
jgi:phage head maturation protease